MHTRAELDRSVHCAHIVNVNVIDTSMRPPPMAMRQARTTDRPRGRGVREPARGPAQGETGKPRRRAFLSRRRLSPVRIRVSSLATEEKVSDRDAAGAKRRGRAETRRPGVIHIGRGRSRGIRTQIYSPMFTVSPTPPHNGAHNLRGDVQPSFRAIPAIRAIREFRRDAPAAHTSAQPAALNSLCSYGRSLPSKRTTVLRAAARLVT